MGPLEACLIAILTGFLSANVPRQSYIMVSGGTPSIGHATLPVLEVLCKPTLTLFVEKPFLFWREKIFQKENLRTSAFGTKWTLVNGRCQLKVIRNVGLTEWRPA